MVRRREDRLRQAPGYEPDNGPPRKRYRSVWTYQPTFPFYGIIVAALLMFDGVLLFDRLQHYANPKGNPIRPPMRHNKTNSSHTNGGLSPNAGIQIVQDCKTCERRKLASEVLPKAKLTVDPCDDFYRYACGKFTETEILVGSNTATAFTKVHDVLETQLLETVSEEIQPNEIMPFRIVKNLYKLCMNKTAIEDQGLKPLLDKLNKFGGWPVLTGGEWTNEELSRSWMKSLRTSRTLGLSFDYFFDVSVGVDWLNPYRRIIYVDQPTLGISREDLVQCENNTNVEEYFNSMVNLTVSLGAKKERARSELQEALNFEIALAKITLPNEKRRNALYKRMSVKDFQRKYPYTWLTFFNEIFHHTSVIIYGEEIIAIKNPSFMDQLFPLLDNTPKRAIANYVMWRVVQSSSSFLPKTLPRSSVLSPEQEQRHRAKECVDVITERLPIAVGALYARNYFDEEARREVLDMVNETKHAFLNILDSVNWMDKTTRTIALERMNSMVFYVGYPNEIMDDNKINEYYKGLGFVELEDSYLNTVLYIDRFLLIKNLNKLHQVVNKTDWTIHSNPTDVYAHYSSFENSIQIPAHYFQPPFYSLYWPNYMNYGAIGSVIGRAITHSFDDLGQLLDQIDNPSDLCQTNERIAYLEKAFCIMKQLMASEFSGYNTVADKIADTGAIKVAYKAYKNWEAQYGPDPVLAGLGPKPVHLFWISAAQIWCSKYGQNPTMMCGSTSPDRYRVLEPLTNLAEFSEDFECPPGSPMNPAKKCSVW